MRESGGWQMLSKTKNTTGRVRRPVYLLAHARSTSTPPKPMLDQTRLLRQAGRQAVVFSTPGTHHPRGRVQR